MKKFLSIPATLVAIALMIGGVAFHASAANVTVSIDSKTQLLKDKTIAQIDARINALNTLATRVREMKHLSDTEHGKIDGQIRASINSMTILKAKVATDTDLVSVQNDENAMTQNFRMYGLVLPIGYLQASIDRSIELQGMMKSLAGKLDTHLTASQGAQQSTGSLRTTLTDMEAKIADAEAQTKAAQSLIINISPDKGVASAAAANHTAIVNARAKMKIATKDLEQARKDAGIIVSGLQAGAGIKATATSH